MLKYRNDFGAAQNTTGSHTMETDIGCRFSSNGVIAHCAATHFSACTSKEGILRHHSKTLPKDSSISSGQILLPTERNPLLQPEIQPLQERGSPTSSKAPVSWVCPITSGRDATNLCENPRNWKLQGAFHLRAAGRGPSRGSVRDTRQHSEDNIITSLNRIRNHQTHSLRCSPPRPPPVQAIWLVLIKYTAFPITLQTPSLLGSTSLLLIRSTQVSASTEAKRVVCL